MSASPIQQLEMDGSELLLPGVIRTPEKIAQTGKAEAMFSQLFAGQLEAMARQMATQFNIDPEAAVKMANEHAASIDIKSMEKPTRRRATGTRKPKAPVTAEHRCMARVWGTGKGNDQCKCARGEGSDYCSRHAKQAAICEMNSSQEPNWLHSLLTVLSVSSGDLRSISKLSLIHWKTKLVASRLTVAKPRKNPL